MRSVEEARFGHVLKTREKLLETEGIKCADGFREVPINWRVVKWQCRAREIFDHPRENRVLGQVVKTAICRTVTIAFIKKTTCWLENKLLSFYRLWTCWGREDSRSWTEYHTAIAAWPLRYHSTSAASVLISGATDRRAQYHPKLGTGIWSVNVLYSRFRELNFAVDSVF